MSDFFTSIDHNNPDSPSMGPSTGYYENFEASLLQQYRVDSFFSLEAELYDRYKRNAELYEKVTRTPLADFSAEDFGYDMMTVAARRAAGQSGAGGLISEATAKAYASKLDRAEAAVASIKPLAPELRSFSEILDDVKKLRQDTEGHFYETYDAATGGGVVGSMVGLMAGSLNFQRDPLLSSTLLFGGVGRTAAMRIATEMGLAGAIGVGQEFGGVQPTRELLDEPYRNPWGTVASFAVGAGVIRGGFEALGPLARALAPRGGPRAPSLEIAELDFRDAQLAEMFADAPDTPTTRAGISFLADARSFDAANPYGTTHAAEVRFTQELFDAHARANGSTAVGRFLPAEPYYLADEVLDMDLVRGERPEIMRRYDIAKEKLAATDINALGITDRVSELSLAADTFSFSTIVKEFNDVVPAQVRELEARLADTELSWLEQARITGQLGRVLRDVQKAAQAEITRLDASVDGLTGLAKARAIGRRERLQRFVDTEITHPKEELGKVRQERRTVLKEQEAAKVEYNLARDEVDKALKEIELQQKVADLMHAVDAAATFTVIRHSPVEAGVSIPRPQHVIDELPAMVTQADEVIEPQVKQTLEANVKPEEPVVEGQPAKPKPTRPELRDDGLIDLGDGTLVDAKLVFDFGEGSMSAREAMQDIFDDDAMVEAMRVCAI